jgi:hypothetical protein
VQEVPTLPGASIDSTSTQISYGLAWRGNKLNSSRLLLIGLSGLILISVSSSTAQQVGLDALDTPVDPASIAMGESFVAVHSPSSVMYNPAGLGGLQGISFQFARRNLNYSNALERFKYLSYSGTLETPFANLGLYYNRFVQGTATVTSAASPEGVGEVELANYVLGLVVARSVTPGFDIGIAAKTFRYVRTAVSGTARTANTNTPLLFDLGAIYTLRSELTNGAGKFSISTGVALQNFGTDLKDESFSSMTEMETEVIVRLPHYLRLGFSLSVEVVPLAPDGLIPFALLVTGEYRNVLNGQLEDNRSYWGAGGEVSLFEFVTGRIGAYIQPHRSIYGSRGDPSLRLGAGLKVPLARLGIESPLTLTFDYGVIPMNTALPYLYIANTALQCFSLGVRYDNPVSW